jgi:hypothetical protein
VAAEPGQQAGPQRVEQPVAVQLGSERLDLRQCGLRTLEVAGRHGPVEQHHRGRGQLLEPVVQHADLAPVGFGITGGFGVQRGDGRLDLVGTGRAHREGLVEQPGGLGDQLFVPVGPVLLGEPDQPPPAVEPGGGPGLVQQLQREQAEDLRLARHQPVQQPGQGHGLGGEVAPGGLAARAGQVALVEDQVDDREDLGESFGQVVGIGHAHVGVHRLQDLAGPEQALGHGGFGDQEGGGDLGRGQSADGAQGERDLRLPGQRRVAAGEHHAQQLVVFGVGAVPGVGHGGGEQRELLLAGPGPAQPVDGLAARRGGQPAAAVGRDLAVPPVLDGLDEGVLNGVFGQAHIAEPRG